MACLEKNELQLIKGIKFTRREIDIISCLINGRRIKKISTLLTITSRTTETHIRNITQKLNCNSQEGIIDFVERSEQRELLKNHYQGLVDKFLFETQLHKISQKVKESYSVYFVKDEAKDRKTLTLWKELKIHLEMSGISVTSNANACSHILYITSSNLIPEHILTTPKIIPVLLHEEDLLLPDDLKKSKIICFQRRDSYYLLVFKIVKEILPAGSVEEFMTNFTAKSETVKLREKVDSQHTIPRNTSVIGKLGSVVYKHLKSNFYVTSLLLCVISFSLASVYVFKTNPSRVIVRSDLVIPDKSSFLDRPFLLDEMQKKLQIEGGINKIALLGFGGAGKTTLARQFARQYPSKIIWEINAETETTLFLSFRNLAYSLSRTEEEKNELIFIDKIKNVKFRNKRLIELVKSILKRNSNWLLIFDNLKSLKELKKYFPNDTVNWGKGSVIITTQNSHIKSANFINPKNVIQIDELLPEEAFDLFTKILYGPDITDLDEKIIIETRQFLEHIPLFPLDIVSSAFYLKKSGMSYDNYLKSIYQYSEKFDSNQMEFLSQATEYEKTRHAILERSFIKILKENPKSKEIFFLSFILDSQELPYAFLQYFSDSYTLDSFLNELTSYSFVMNDSSALKNKITPNFSLHRSVLVPGKEYILSQLTNAEKEKLLAKTISALKSFYDVHSYEASKFTPLIPHINVLRGNLKLFDLSSELDSKYNLYLDYLLGYIYYYGLGDFIKSKVYFTRIVENKHFRKYFTSNELATLFKDLCGISVKLNELDHCYCKKSIKMCKESAASNLVVAEALLSLGSIYRKQNDFNRSQQHLKEALSVAKNLKNKDKRQKEMIASISSQIAWLYYVHFIHKNPFHESGRYIENALRVLNADVLYHKEKTQPKHKLSCTVLDTRLKLGMIYSGLARYKEALTQGFWEAKYILDESLSDCPATTLIKGQLYEGIGEVFLRKGQLAEAEDSLSEAIETFQKLLGNQQTMVAKSWRIETRIRLGKLDEAYTDIRDVLETKKRQKSNIHNLLYITNYYHAALIMYKKNDFLKSLDYFNVFFREIDVFCQAFLQKDTYQSLEKEGVFEEITDNYSEYGKFNQCQERARKIFTVIYSPIHPFVKDYVMREGISRAPLKI